MEPWILPIIQGYVEIHRLVVHSNNPPDVLQTQQPPCALVRKKRGNSRRSRRKDGTGEEGEEVEMIKFEDEKPERVSKCKEAAAHKTQLIFHIFVCSCNQSTAPITSDCK